MALGLTKGDYEINLLTGFFTLGLVNNLSAETTMSQEGQYIFNSLGSEF